MENMDIFNLQADDFAEKNDKRESDFYKADPRKGQDGVHKSLVRFLLWWKDPKNSKIKKFSYWLTDPLTGDGFSVDCPSTINQKSILQDTFWKLKKSQSVAEQKLSDKFKRRENYYALVQVVKDSQQPQLEGKIKIFKFGMKLNGVIQAEIQPEYGTPHIPWDPLNGKLMALTVTVQSGFNNYDQTRFVGEPEPVKIDGNPITNDPAGRDVLMKWLETNSPDLSTCDYREWDDEMKSKVRSVIENTVPSMRTADDIESSASSFSPSKDISLDAPTTSSPVDTSTDEKKVDLDDVTLENFESNEGDSNNFENDLYSGL